MSVNKIIKISPPPETDNIHILVLVNRRKIGINYGMYVYTQSCGLEEREKNQFWYPHIHFNLHKNEEKTHILTYMYTGRSCWKEREKEKNNSEIYGHT